MPSSRAIYKLHPVTMWQTTPAYVTALAPHCALPPFTCIRSNAKRCGSPFLHQAQACTSHSVKSAACVAAAQAQQLQDVTDMKEQAPIQFEGVHHVGFIIEDKETSRKFYCDTLGLSVNEDRPNDKLNFDGLWLWLGPEMLHLMVVDDPDPKTGRPEHGGRDRHVCLGVTDITPVENRLKAGGIEYTASKSGRKAVFFRDPDMNTLEVFESKPWR